MDDLNVIDRFLDAFIRYIDSGFGLLGGDVAFLTSVLIGIDITLAGLFWALGGEDDILGRFVRKILYVGAFALILTRFEALADIIFRSFAGLGLKAGGGTLSEADLLRPGRLAGTGFEAAWPLLDQASRMLGFTTFFDSFLTIMILLIAWVVVILAFFLLSVQVFITIIEFKLTTLAGFVLVPFALWNRTSFLAERVLGNVVSSGIKLMVLAAIIGIGSGFFLEFIGALQGKEPDIGEAMSLVLASLALFGLGIFGPGIASGLVAGAPQLGAGAAVGTALGAAGALAAGAGAAAGAARTVGGGTLGAIRAGTALGSAAGTAARLSSEAGGSSFGGVLGVAGAAARMRLSGAAGLGAAAERGQSTAWRAIAGGGAPAAGAEAAREAAPAWARQLRAQQTARHRRHLALQSVKEGDRGGRVDEPRHQGKGREVKFKRSVQRYGRTPEPETPYQRAGQLWDERIGSARVQAQSWRMMAYGGLLLASGLSAALVWQSSQSRVIPYVVEVDRLGEARAVAPADQDYRPTDPQIAWHLARFIKQVRSVSLDPVLMREGWLAAYDMATPRAARFLSDYARAAKPFADAGDRSVSVQVTSVVRASETSFQVEWTESVYERGNLVETSRWTAMLTISMRPPRSAETLRNNPLGLYVDAIDWSRKLEPPQPAAATSSPNLPLGSPLDPTLGRDASLHEERTYR